MSTPDGFQGNEAVHDQTVEEQADALWNRVWRLKGREGKKEIAEALRQAQADAYERAARLADEEADDAEMGGEIYVARKLADDIRSHKDKTEG